MIDTLLQLDQDALLALNSLRSPFFDNLLFMFSGKLVWGLMYLTMLIALFQGFENKKVAIVWTLAIILTIVLADQLCATVIRPYFERLRPSNPENPISSMVNIVNDYRGGRYGFPSCHAANSFGLAIITALIWRGGRVGWFIFIWAIINSYSRTYIGVHYPGDLLVGAVVGLLSGTAVYLLGKILVRRLTIRRPIESLPLMKTAEIGRLCIRYKSIDYAVVIGIITITELVLISF